MTDRERQLEAEVAWLRYGSKRMNLVLREPNTVWNKSEEGEDGSESGDEEKEGKPEFNHVIVCG
jgi:hypothetical protein